MLWLVKGLGPGGAEHLLVSHARVRDRTAYDVETAYVLPHKDQLAAPLEALGVPCTCLGTGRRGRWLWPVRLRSLVRAHRVDVVHVHSPLVAGVARLVLRTLPRRPGIVSTEHNTWDSYAWPTRVLNASLHARDDVRLAVSDQVRKSVWKPLRRDVRTAVHGIVLEDVDQPPGTRERVRAELGAGPDDVVALTVANFRVQKGHRDLLEVAQRVLREQPRTLFVWVGQGPLADETAAAVAAAGLSERVLLTGYRPDVPALMCAADVFLMGSHVEGYPIAVMEALACGLPVVSTAVGGIPTAVREGVEGWLVPPHQPDRLAAALLPVVSDPVLRRRVSEAARARGRGFDVRAAVGTIEAVYLEVNRRRVTERPHGHRRGSRG